MVDYSYEKFMEVTKKCHELYENLDNMEDQDRISAIWSYLCQIAEDKNVHLKEVAL